MRIYFDNAATTKIDTRVYEKMQPYLSDLYGNASSIHFMGQEANSAIEKARNTIANILNCDNSGLIFTSGATESNNFILKGVMQANKTKGKHLIISEIEHPCVINSAKQLSNNGFQVDILPVDEDGIVNLNKLKMLLKPDTVLVSIMYVNNEIGTIQDIESISKIVHGNGSYLHVDAVQAVPYLNIDINKLKIDFLSLSSHKFYGPKGVGIAYIRKNIPIEPLIIGGHQESGLRAGTYNTPGIVGAAEALKLIYTERDPYLNKVGKLRDKIWSEISKRINDIRLNGTIENGRRTPNNLNFSLKNVDALAIISSLSNQGICISAGSACSAGTFQPSHVIKALNPDDDYLKGALRISLGKYNTEEEVDIFIEEFIKTARNLGIK